MVDKVFATYQEMLTKRHKANEYTITHLLDACARAKQAGRGQECFDKLTALHNILPTTVCWNALLGVYNHVGDMV